MEYYWAIKNNKFESVVVRWMNLEPGYTEWRQKEKNKHDIYGIQKNDTYFQEKNGAA